MSRITREMKCCCLMRKLYVSLSQGNNFVLLAHEWIHSVITPLSAFHLAHSFRTRKVKGFIRCVIWSNDASSVWEKGLIIERESASLRYASKRRTNMRRSAKAFSTLLKIHYINISIISMSSGKERKVGECNLIIIVV